MKIRYALSAAAMTMVSFSAHGQFIVNDPPVLVQAIQQVKAWRDQYQQMRAQIDSMNNQLRALTGSRGMATILPAGIPALPDDWVHTMTQLSSLAQEIRRTQAILTPAQSANIPVELQQFLAQTQSLSAANQAMAQTAFNDAAARQSRLQTLIATLATTQDPKAAYDLGNRIAIEHAALVKDQNQLEAAASGAAAQDRAQRLMIDQMRVAGAGTSIPTIDTSLP